MINSVFFILLGSGIFFSFLRLIKGPTPFDRVISLDAINIILTGGLVVLALLLDNKLYLDISLVFAVLAFLETIVFAKYLGGAQ